MSDRSRDALFAITAADAKDVALCDHLVPGRFDVLSAINAADAAAMHLGGRLQGQRHLVSDGVVMRLLPSPPRMPQMSAVFGSACLTTTCFFNFRVSMMLCSVGGVVRSWPLLPRMLTMCTLMIPSHFFCS